MEIAGFRLLDQAGKGGMGVVWKAEDLRLRRPVALKFLPPSTVTSPERRDQMLAEARLAASLRGRGAVQVHSWQEVDGLEFIVMEWVDGESLEQRLARSNLTEHETLQLGVDVARTLAQAHARGLVHRDIKPGNLLLRAEGGVAIVDFGMAALFADEHPNAELPTTAPGGEPKVWAGGTVAYMSADRLRGGSPPAARDDLYSLGVVLFECLTGQRPFEGGNTLETISRILSSERQPLGQLSPSINPRLVSCIEQCLACGDSSRPVEDVRPITTSEVASELEAILAGVPSAAVPSSVDSARVRGRSPGGWNPRLLAALAVGALGLPLGGWLLWSSSWTPLNTRRIVVMPLNTSAADSSGRLLGHIISESISAGVAAADTSLEVLPVPDDAAPGGRAASTRRLLRQARGLGAGRCVTGEVVRMGDSLMVRATLLDVERGAVLWGAMQTADDRLLNRVVHDVVEGLVGRLGSPRGRRTYPYIGNLVGSQAMAQSALLSQTLLAYITYETRDLDSLSRLLVEEFPDELDAHVLRAAGLRSRLDVAGGTGEHALYRNEVAYIRARDPNSPYPDILEAVRLRVGGQAKAAITILEPCLSRSDLQPSARSHILRQLASAEMVTGQLDRAWTRLSQARGLDPTNSANYEQLAALSRRQARPDESLEFARLGLAIAPRSSILLMDAAVALERLDRWDEASDLIRQAAMQSGSQTHWGELAVTLAHASRQAAADSAATVGAATPPTAWGQINLARYHSIVGHHSEALRCLDQALDLGFADVDFWQETDVENLKKLPGFSKFEAELRRRTEH